MADAVTKTITGVCQEISEKNGWTAFSIDVGSEWPVRVATKLEKLVAEGRAVGQELATWTYKEVESDKINEKSGKPFVNRYLEKVEAGGSEDQLEQLGERQQRQQPGLIGADKDRSIVRQVALKATGQVFSGAANAGEDEKEILKRFLMFAGALETWAMSDLGSEENDAPF